MFVDGSVGYVNIIFVLNLAAGDSLVKGLVFEGDPTDHDGFVMTATSTIIEDGKRAALVGDLVNCPRDDHGVNPIVEGDSSMMDNGKYLVTHLNRAACGCRIFARHTTLLAG